jgi:hypothetical protein
VSHHGTLGLRVWRFVQGTVKEASHDRVGIGRQIKVIKGVMGGGAALGRVDDAP